MKPDFLHHNNYKMKNSILLLLILALGLLNGCNSDSSDIVCNPCTVVSIASYGEYYSVEVIGHDIHNNRINNTMVRYLTFNTTNYIEIGDTIQFTKK